MEFGVIGDGRAGSSFRLALEGEGWTCKNVFLRGDDVRSAANNGLHAILLAVPDAVIGALAGAIEPGPSVVVHLSGATTLEPLSDHPHTGSIHPLVSLRGGATGAKALLGANFAVAGSTARAADVCQSVVSTLSGTAFVVPDTNRAIYHATATVAANHLVVLCAQIERLATRAGVPVAGFWDLMAGVLHNVGAQGAEASLTGPVARADWYTVSKHLAAVDGPDGELYRALARSAAELAGHEWPAMLDSPLGDTPDR